MSVDVAVIGAGIVGCSAARRAARNGARVVVLDPEEPGRQASWAAAGMISPQAEAVRDDEFFRLLLRARARFPSLVRELADETGIDVGYATDAGLLLLSFTADEQKEAEERLTWQSAAGLRVELLGNDQTLELEPALSPGIHGALLFPDDHQLENRLLTRALWHSAAAAGAEFRVGTSVVGLHRKAAGTALELDDGQMLQAEKIVLAAGSWSGSVRGLPRSIPVEPIHGQLIAIENTPPTLLRHVIVSSRGYLVPRADGRVIAGTTAERLGYRTGLTTAGLRHITSIAVELAPALSFRTVVAQWSGLRPGTPDGFPILGPDPDLPALLYATGHFRNGILLGPLTGEIIADMACGQGPDIDLSLYRPDRPFNAPDQYGS